MGNIADYHDNLRALAEGICLRAKAIGTCEHHDGVYLDNGDPDAVKDAYRIANAKITAGEIDVPRKQLTEAIDQVIADAPFDCPDCVRNAES